ncbi:KH domain-containing protein [Dietzia sp.]|uniref:KH domain-containing protein n=1 Tax=Dietzia sp. TaxID=1871616 RepID=UPI002FDB32A4
MRNDVAEAVEHLVRGIVSEPDAVTVRTDSGRRGTVVSVSVAPTDQGRVIGRRGRTATALRTVVSAIGGKGYRVEITD